MSFCFIKVIRKILFIETYRIPAGVYAEFISVREWQDKKVYILELPHFLSFHGIYPLGFHIDSLDKRDFLKP